MSTNYGFPPIITDGLRAVIDPGNISCYTSGSTICTNLISGETGSLFGSLTGSMSEYDSWNFLDTLGTGLGGTPNYITMNTLISSSFLHNDWSVSNWIKPTLDDYTGGPGGRTIWSIHYEGDNRFICFINQLIAKGYGTIQYFTSETENISSSVIPEDSWTHVTTTLLEGITDGIKFYINGVKVPMEASVNYDEDKIDQFTIGAEWDAGPSVGDFYSGSRGPTIIYNRVLTPTEVKYNYEIQKARFGH